MPHASREHADIAELKKLLKRSANEVGRSVEALGNPHRISRKTLGRSSLEAEKKGAELVAIKACEHLTWKSSACLEEKASLEPPTCIRK